MTTKGRCAEDKFPPMSEFLEQSGAIQGQFFPIAELGSLLRNSITVNSIK
jgi:hypothetical protein